MISRYSTTAMQDIWSDSRKLEYWLQIEKAVVREWAKLGVISFEDAQLIENNATFTLEKVIEYEQKTKHDFAAFVDVLSDSVGKAGRWIHYGLTSSDVIDTALSLQLRDASQQIINNLVKVIEALWILQYRHGLDLMVGRTHGMYAEPTTLGHKLMLWINELNRHFQRMLQTKQTISVGAISGTVGSYSTVDPRIEKGVCEEFGLTPELSSQIISRDRHAEFIWVLAAIATTLDSIATEIRLLSRSEVGEIQEGFADGQKGSSAMPHKKNPVRCERISGLARIVRSYLVPALENNVTWHERDISHSSVERLMFPDASNLVDFMLQEMEDILNNLVINSDNMMNNLKASNGIIYSHRILLALIKKGLSRQEAYRVVQDSAFTALQDNITFDEVIKTNEVVTRLLNAAEIDKCFDPKVQYSFFEYDTMPEGEVT